MHRILAGVHLNSYANDRLIWKFDKNEEFTVKPISQLLMEKRTQADGFNAFSFTKSILTWFVLLGRVNTKDRLHRLGICSGLENRSPTWSNNQAQDDVGLVTIRGPSRAQTRTRDQT